MLFPQAKSCVFLSSVNGFAAISQTVSARKQGLLGVFLLAFSHPVSRLPATSPKYKSQKEEIRKNFDSFSVNW